MTAAEILLQQSLHLLVDTEKRLTGLCVAYGTGSCHESRMVGFASEYAMRGGQIVPFRRPLTAHTIYDLASLTKCFTLTALLLLVQDRKIRLTDCIGVLDTRFKRLADVSVFDVMTYRANLQSERRIDGCADAAAAENEVFSIFRSSREPEKRYSDMNALALKYVIETVSGADFYSFLKQRILLPLGMANTYARVPDEKLCDLAHYNLEHRVVKGRWAIEADITIGEPHDPKARKLFRGGDNLSGHAGLFSTVQDMVLFAQSFLNGALLHGDMMDILKRFFLGYLKADGQYQQYLTALLFKKSKVQRLSEMPSWMTDDCFGISGYTGNHLAVDPRLGVFDLFLGNRCNMRLSNVIPLSDAGGLGLREDGAGVCETPNGYSVYSSHLYVYQKDDKLHAPIYQRMKERGWL